MARKNSARTTKKVASVAGKTLKATKSKTVKKLAGSVLSNRRPKA